MKILYFTLRDFPHPIANRLQTIKMVDAFAHSEDVTLSVSFLNCSEQKLRENYDVKEPFKLIEIGKTNRRPYTLFKLPMLIKAIFSDSYDMYFCREDLLAFLLALFNRPFVFEIHDLPFTAWKLRLFSLMVRRAKLIVFISDEIRKNFEQQGFNAQKSIIVGSGIDPDMFANVSPSPVSNGIIKITYTGRLQERKGVLTLIRALKHLPETYILSLVGGYAGEHEQIIDYATQHGVDDRVTLHGYKDYNEIPAIMAAADILVLPNDTIEQSFNPLKLREYLLSGRPVVVSDAFKNNPLAQDEFVFLFPKKNEEALAKALVAATNSEDAKQKTTRAVCEAKSYSWRIRVKEILDAYNKAINHD